MIRIVLGNESADLDSAVASTVYAYFLHSVCPETNGILHLPVLNTNAETFRLRTEIRSLFGENFSKVIFIRDVPIDQLFVEEKLEIVLVDHHSLPAPLSDAVVEILDHHQVKKDSTVVVSNPSAVRIEPVGSCCTLIAEKMLAARSEFSMSEDVASLLIGKFVANGKEKEEKRLDVSQVRSFSTR